MDDVSLTALAAPAFLLSLQVSTCRAEPGGHAVLLERTLAALVGEMLVRLNHTGRGWGMQVRSEGHLFWAAACCRCMHQVIGQLDDCPAGSSVYDQQPCA